MFKLGESCQSSRVVANLTAGGNQKRIRSFFQSFSSLSSARVCSLLFPFDLTFPPHGAANNTFEASTTILRGEKCWQASSGKITRPTEKLNVYCIKIFPGDRKMILTYLKRWLIVQPTELQ